MTKVLFVSNDPAIFDEKSAVRARMHAYASEIGELHILTSAPRGARELQEGALFLHPLRVSKLLRMRLMARRARDLIEKYRIEVVSAQDPFEHGVAAARAVRGTEARLHVQIHTDFLSPWFVRAESWRPRALLPALLNRWRVRTARRVLPKASGIRVVSERIKRSLLQTFGSSIAEPTVIPITVDEDVPTPEPLPPHLFKFSLLFVGRLEAEKRVQDIFEALALVREKYPMVGLFVVGEGRERRALEKRVETLNLSAHVRFLGAVPEARALMGSAQAVIQSSAYEGYGRTLMEAALAKVPLITTDVGIVGDILKPEVDALVARVHAPKELARHIVHLLEDHDLRTSLRVHAEEAARTHLRAEGSLPLRIAADLAHDSTQLFRGSALREV